jgi:ribonuclease-3
MESLESRIGHSFRNPALLAEALTHPSLSYETKRREPDYERLEFLGDSILGVVVCDELFRRMPEADEGVLSRLRSRLVSAPTLARLARQLDLGRHLRLGRAEEFNGGRDRESTLANALEALIAALYLDSALETTRGFLLALFEKELRDVVEERPEMQNPKGQLQEVLQGASGITPLYEIVSSEGPDHQRRYEAAAKWEGQELGRGFGASKKEAEIEAARSALGSEILNSLLKKLEAMPRPGSPGKDM